MGENELQHKRQIQDGKRVVVEILLNLAKGMGLEPDYRWCTKSGDVHAPLRTLGPANSDFHRLWVTVGERQVFEDFSSDELADHPRTDEIRRNVERRLTDLLGKLNLRQGRIGF